MENTFFFITPEKDKYFYIYLYIAGTHQIGTGKRDTISGYHMSRDMKSVIRNKIYFIKADIR